MVFYCFMRMVAEGACWRLVRLYSIDMVVLCMYGSVCPVLSLKIVVCSLHFYEGGQKVMHHNFFHGNYSGQMYEIHTDCS
jgi:hypothetical protein